MNRIEKVKESVLGWLEQIRYKENGWGLFRYNISALRPYSSESSATAIGIYAKLGELEKIDETLRKEAIASIRSWQNPETGLFIDPLVKDSDRVSGWGDHTWDHIWKHNTLVCEGALSNLGERPLHRHQESVFVKFDNPSEASDYVLGLDWSNPWRVGEHLHIAIRAYRDSHNLGKGQTDETIETAFSTYEQKILDPATGLPSLSFGGAPFRSMAGAFKMLNAYPNFGRKYPYTREAIDSTLKLQRPDGAFDEGGACLNWDSLCVLRGFSSEIDNAYRFDDIKRAALKLERKIHSDYAKPDGAYSFCSSKCLEAHNSVKVSEPAFESDVVGTSMYLTVFEYLDEWGI